MHPYQSHLRHHTLLLHCFCFHQRCWLKQHCPFLKHLSCSERLLGVRMHWMKPAWIAGMTARPTLSGLLQTRQVRCTTLNAWNKLCTDGSRACVERVRIARSSCQENSWRRNLSPLFDVGMKGGPSLSNTKMDIENWRWRGYGGSGLPVMPTFCI